MIIYIDQAHTEVVLFIITGGNVTQFNGFFNDTKRIRPDTHRLDDRRGRLAAQVSIEKFDVLGFCPYAFSYDKDTPGKIALWPSLDSSSSST
ncbi:hypothetical protein OVA15_04380 [Kocuria sp. SL71]|nr:hypothetical protein [Kocuria sp. SL71]MCY1683627.1 hypothetical protein [Kocuria sp. SL71]